MAVATTPTDNLQWNFEPYFPGVDSSEFRSAVGDLNNLMAAAETAIQGTDILAALSALEAVFGRAETVVTYAELLVAANAKDEAAQAAVSSLRPLLTRVGKAEKVLTAKVGAADVEALAAACPSHEYPLRKMAFAAQRLMDGGLEDLASDLAETGGSSWSKLYDDYISELEVEVNGNTVPMSACRAMAYDGDHAVRADAYSAELATWKANETTIAACLNSIKGEASLLAKRRNWPEQLDQTLFHSNMDRASLDAMLSAAEDAFPAFRRYLKAKAKTLGYSGGLKWSDLFAPCASGTEWSWEAGKQFVAEGFRSYSDKMGDFALQSFDEGWHDVNPRPGKSDGAFCASMGQGVSRMLHNYKPAFGSVSTLAHELGHAYHNLCLTERREFQKRTPMTLAETASIFCETIVKRRAIAETSGQDRLAILEASLQGACQTVVDISSRYRFETALIAARKERDLSPREICALMTKAQDETYGDGLCDRHPYMWAAKPHYYSYDAFYNFPYMFGLLFALGLYRVYQQDPEGFKPRYDELLSSTGLADAAELTKQFGVDIRSKEFWAGSLAVIEEDIAAYERETSG